METLPPNMSTGGESDPAAVPAESPHGIEVGAEFKPVERPVEPVNLDQPVKCPLPEPSILHVSQPRVLIAQIARENHVADKGDCISGLFMLQNSELKTILANCIIKSHSSFIGDFTF